MRIILLVTLLTIADTCLAQSALTAENFETQILLYEPVKNAEVTDKDFNYGSMIITEMKKAVKGDTDGFNVADYFNVLSAFLSLQESPENVALAFEKFLSADRSCEYLGNFEDVVLNSDKYTPVVERWMGERQRCGTME